MLRLSYMLGSAIVITALAVAGLYTWTGSVANPESRQAQTPPASPAASAPAGRAIPEAAIAARGAELAKLTFSEPRPVPGLSITDPSGGSHQLADWQGKWLLVNFWAVWCVPCRVEMPALDNLQAELGGEEFEVVTIASGRNEPAQIDRFFAEAGVTRLPKLLDPKMALAAQMGVPGLPVSVLIDPEGNEVARLIGDAEWDSDAAKAVIRALIAG